MNASFLCTFRVCVLNTHLEQVLFDRHSSLLCSYLSIKNYFSDQD